MCVFKAELQRVQMAITSNSLSAHLTDNIPCLGVAYVVPSKCTAHFSEA